MEYKELFELVKVEAANLRKHATPEEIAKLDFERFDAGDPSGCIYGQATGRCYSKRAHQLINLCCVKMFIDYDYAVTILDDVKDLVDVKLEEKEEPDSSHRPFFSPIERYILENQESDRRELNAQLIQYLQGRIENLPEPE